MPIIAYGSASAITPRTAFSQPADSAIVPQIRRVAAAAYTPSGFDERLAQWMQKVESNVQQAVGHSHRVAMVAEGVAEQEFYRAHQEAGAAQQLGRQLDVFQGAAEMEMNPLSETLATCEHSELRLAQTSNVQHVQIEAEANALFQQRVNTIQIESLAERRLVVARM